MALGCRACERPAASAYVFALDSMFLDPIQPQWGPGTLNRAEQADFSNLIKTGDTPNSWSSRIHTLSVLGFSKRLRSPHDVRVTQDQTREFRLQSVSGWLSMLLRRTENAGSVTA
jgi:hypothetical protein